jgi:hypothetical protein
VYWSNAYLTEVALTRETVSFLKALSIGLYRLRTSGLVTWGLFSIPTPLLRGGPRWDGSARDAAGAVIAAHTRRPSIFFKPETQRTLDLISLFLPIFKFVIVHRFSLQ